MDPRINHNCRCLITQISSPENPSMLNIEQFDIVLVEGKEDHNWALIRKGVEIGIYPWKALTAVKTNLPPDQTLLLDGYKGLFYKCSACNLVFENRSTYNRHVHRYPLLQCSNAIKCLRCSSIFHNQTKLNRHKCRMVKFNRNCKLCNKQFRFRSCLYLHYKKHRVVQSCVTCGNKCTFCQAVQHKICAEDQTNDADDDDDGKEEPDDADDQTNDADDDDYDDGNDEADDAKENTGEVEANDDRNAAGEDRLSDRAVDHFNNVFVDAIKELLNKTVGDTIPNSTRILRSAILRKDLISQFDKERESKPRLIARQERQPKPLTTTPRGPSF